MSDITITEAHVNALFNQSHIEAIRMGRKTTVVCCTLPNGFTVVESAACVDPANYDHEKGQNICYNRIKEKLWELEGYLLQQEKYEASLEKKIEPITQDVVIGPSEPLQFAPSEAVAGFQVSGNIQPEEPTDVIEPKVEAEGQDTPQE